MTSFKIVSFLLVSLSFLTATAQSTDSTEVIRRQLTSQRVATAPVLDGEVDELWQTVPKTDGFTNLEPTFGGLDPWNTTVRFAYDDQAIYLLAEMYYPNADSISREVRPRDQIGNADWFGVIVDPYRSGVNGFGFYSIVTGGQFDAIYSSNGEDDNWDAVWRNAVQIQPDGTVVMEMAIPYSALRFPEAPVQNWFIQFGRRTAINQVKSFWNPIDPNRQGFLNQSGDLIGLRDLQPPVRIQALPFAVFSAADYIQPGTATPHTWDAQFAGGLDLKVGLNDAFTLDMTLIPDFSEARQDNQGLNLSPFEVRFDENRPFFTEGVELFNKGNFFYSRRIGGQPLNFYDAYGAADEMGGEVVSNPGNSRLLNATKVSGRTEGGTGIGILNAISAESRAIIRDPENGESEFMTQPLTNYNVAVVDQLLPNNSFATLVNTNVWRGGSTYDANLTGLVFNLLNKKNTYGLSGQTALSQKYSPEGNEFGHQIELEFGDVDGTWTWDVGYEEWSPTYDQGDLGFQRRNNYREFSGSIGFFQAQEWGPFNRMGAGLNMGYQTYVETGDYSEYWFNIYTFGRTKNNWNINPWMYVEPFGSRDRFEPRVAGSYLTRPGFGRFGASVRSDDRKSVFFWLFGALERFWDDPYGQSGWDFGVEPNWRVNTQLSLSVETFIAHNDREIGFATFSEGEPVFGTRDRDIVTNSARMRYTIHPNLGFDLRLRHYWSRVGYQEYFDLETNGDLTRNDAHLDAIDRDQTFNALTADLIGTWRFAPGSDIILVWKNALFAGSGNSELGYFETWNGLLNEPQTQTFTIKMNYWLDYDELRRKL